MLSMVFYALNIHSNIQSDFASNLKAILSFSVLNIYVHVFYLKLGTHFPLGTLFNDDYVLWVVYNDI